MTMHIVFTQDKEEYKKGQDCYVERSLARKFCERDIALTYKKHLDNIYDAEQAEKVAKAQAEVDAKEKLVAKAKADKEKKAEIEEQRKADLIAKAERMEAEEKKKAEILAEKNERVTSEKKHLGKRLRKGTIKKQ